MIILNMYIDSHHQNIKIDSKFVSNSICSGLGRDFNDLYQFDPSRLAWTMLVSNNNQSIGAPGVRDSHGFVSAGAKLYVFGGLNSELGGCPLSFWSIVIS
jgi:hypothetical protein